MKISRAILFIPVIVVLLFLRDALSEDNIEALVRTLQSEESFKVRIQAALLLGRSGDERAVEPLIATLADDEKTVRCAAVIALGNTRHPKAVRPLFEMMEDESTLVAGQAENALDKFGTAEVIPYLIDVFLSPGFGVEARAKCVRLLTGTNDERAIAALTNGLGEESFEVRELCEKALQSMGAEKEVDFLILALGNERLRVRKEAALKLGRTGNPRAVEALAAALDNPVEADDVKAAARDSLKTLVPLMNVQQLASAAKSAREKRQRVQAILLLGIAAGKGAADVFIEALKDSDVYVRAIAAMTLADIGEQRAIRPLEQMLSDKANQRIFPIIKSSINTLRRGGQ